MNVSFDTNVLISLLVNRDAAQLDAAYRALDHYSTIHLADAAVIETVYVLEAFYERDRDTVRQLLIKALNHPKINANKTLFERAFGHYVSHPKVSFTDCCLALYADFNQAAPLLTFDKKLAKQLQHTQLLV